MIEVHRIEELVQMEEECHWIDLVHTKTNIRKNSFLKIISKILFRILVSRSTVTNMNHWFFVLKMPMKIPVLIDQLYKYK